MVPTTQWIDTDSGGSTTKGEGLVVIPVVAVSNVESITLYDEAGSVFVPWLKGEGPGVTVEGKKL